MAAEQPHDTGGTELGRFLRARRSQVTPADVGFAPATGVRRTPGLRREEVAALAGVSIDYYTRLERGKETRPSPAVTDALARALKLHPRRARAPACPGRPCRPVRPDIYADWDYQVRGCVARLRALAGTDPDAPDLAALIGELLLKSPEFARLWERYDVTRRTAAQQKTFHHPSVGTLTLGFQGMELEGTPGQRLGIYLAESGTPDYDAMILLDMTAPAATKSSRAKAAP